MWVFLSLGASLSIYLTVNLQFDKLKQNPDLFPES